MLRRQQGFTLLEIIIVAFILALIAGTVVVNIAPRQMADDTRTQAVVFREKIQHARQIALIRNWVIGVDVQTQSYAFYRWHNEQWQQIDEPPLGPAYFEDMTLELQMGDYRLLDNLESGERQAVFRTEQDGRNRGTGDDEEVNPRLLIFESTDFIPFTLSLMPGGFSDSLPVWLDGRDGMHLEISEEPL